MVNDRASSRGADDDAPPDRNFCHRHGAEWKTLVDRDVAHQSLHFGDSHVVPGRYEVVRAFSPLGSLGP